MTNRAPETWVTFPRPNKSAKLRVYCFPYAGGGASIFRTWWQDLPSDVEVAAIQLPGRDLRISEPPHVRLSTLVPALADALAPTLYRPYVFFGHSLGALVSFELARELRRRGAPQPQHLLVSGRPAPQIPSGLRRHELSHGQFVEWVRQLNSIPEPLWKEPDLIAMILRVMRADIAVNDAEDYVAEPPLDCPISAFGGIEDAMASRDEVAAWKAQTRGTFSMEMVPGGHFFFQTARQRFMSSLSEILNRETKRMAARVAPFDRSVGIFPVPVQDWYPRVALVG